MDLEIWGGSMTNFIYKTNSFEFDELTNNKDLIRHGLYCFAGFINKFFDFETMLKEMKIINEGKDMPVLVELTFLEAGNTYAYGFICNRNGIFSEWLNRGNGRVFNREKEILYFDGARYSVGAMDLVLWTLKDIAGHVTELASNLYKEKSKPIYN